MPIAGRREGGRSCPGLPGGRTAAAAPLVGCGGLFGAEQGLALHRAVSGCEGAGRTGAQGPLDPLLQPGQLRSIPALAETRGDQLLSRPKFQGERKLYGKGRTLHGGSEAEGGLQGGTAMGAPGERRGGKQVCASRARGTEGLSGQVRGSNREPEAGLD